MEMGLSLLAQSHFPNQFWDDAFLRSAYIINWLRTPLLSNESAFSKLFHQTPDYTLLRVFGCACNPLLRPYLPHKLAFKSKQCIFLGFSSNHIGYEQCFDPISHLVYLSCNVVFDEKSFHDQHRSLLLICHRPPLFPTYHNRPMSPLTRYLMFHVVQILVYLIHYLLHQCLPCRFRHQLLHSLGLPHLLSSHIARNETSEV